MNTSCKSALVILFFVFFTGISFGQSKKEQIEALNKRVDSLVEVNVLKSRIIDEKASEIRGLQSDLHVEVNKRLSERDAQNAEIIKLKSELSYKADSIKELYYEKPDIHPVDSLRWGNGESEDVWLRPVDQVLNYLGIYQSEYACELEMPRFTDKVGPTMSVSISALNEYRIWPEGEFKFDYYISINFCEHYTGQIVSNNEKTVSAEIIDFHQEGELVKMTLQASNCAEYYSMNPEEKQEQKMLSSTFVLVMKFLANGKVLISTENAPKLCNHDWGFDNVTFYPLVWSR